MDNNAGKKTPLTLTDKEALDLYTSMVTATPAEREASHQTSIDRLSQLSKLVGEATEPFKTKKLSDAQLAKPFRVTAKEIERASDDGITIVARPQQGGTKGLFAVDVSDPEKPRVRGVNWYEVSEDGDVAKAVTMLNRDLDKFFGLGGRMSDKGRMRPGKKDAERRKNESVNEDDSIGRTIADQMGGAGKMRAMLGATIVAIPNGLAIKWPNRQRTKGNLVWITLEPSDTYKMVFYNAGKGTGMDGKKVVKEYEDVYFDQLVDIFEKQTGWYLRM